MTTTTERLLQLAAEHDQKAQALRLAAAELNGHRVGKKREVLPAQLQAAITLRDTQRPKKQQKQKAKGKKGEQRYAIVEFLRQGPRSKEEVTKFLRERFGYSQGLGALFRYGYVKDTKGGVRLTAKALGVRLPAKATARSRRRSSADAVWKRAQDVLQAKGPMKWPELREALGLSKNTNVSGTMYDHPEAVTNTNGVWSAKV